MYLKVNVNGINFLVKKKGEKYYIQNKELFNYLGFKRKTRELIKKLENEINEYNNLNNEKIEIKLDSSKEYKEMEKKYSFCECNKIYFYENHNYPAVSYEFLDVILDSKIFSEKIKKTIIELKNEIEKEYSIKCENKKQINKTKKNSDNDDDDNDEDDINVDYNNDFDEDIHEKIDGKYVPYVYIFADKNNNWIYVGKSNFRKEKRKRLSEHFSRGKDRACPYIAYDEVDKVYVIDLKTNEEARDVENYLLKAYKTDLKYNIQSYNGNVEKGKKIYDKYALTRKEVDIKKIKKCEQFEKVIKPMKDLADLISKNKKNYQNEVIDLVELVNILYNEKFSK